MAKQIFAVLDQVGPSTSRATVRAHSVYVDRPADKGGADRGPLGGEYQLVALGGCFTSHLLAAIRTRELPIKDVKVEVGGILDGSPERFTAFSLTVSAKAADFDSLQKVVTIAERSCQVLNTLKLAAEVKVSIQQYQSA